MSITLEKINKEVVKPIPLPPEDLKPVKGFSICEEPYANIFLCARKNSGKTTVLFKILKECAGKHTVIIIFCSTAHKDRNYLAIRKYFEKKGNEIRVYTSIYEDGVDQIEELINEITEAAKAKEEEENNEEQTEQIENKDDIFEQLKKHNDILGQFLDHHPNGIEPQNEIKEKKKKTKYLAPEYILVFDDLSSELKSSSLTRLLKFNRHMKMKCLISSQWVHDLAPESRKQLDLFIIFKGFPEKKLEIIHKDIDSAVPFELFYKMYRKATKRPYSFLYCDTRSDSFRRNFNEKFIIKYPEEEI
jgi:hypothetical protein